MYALRVRMDYQDQDYELHEVTELISIPVAQFSRLETQPPELQIMPFMDMFGFVDFEFRILNTGRVPLHNLRVRVEGNFDTAEANDYMGPLAVGRTNTFRGRIRPLEPGFHEGAIIIYAEDDAGEIVEIVHEFGIEVMGGFDGGMEGGMFEGGDFGDGRFPPGGFPGDGGMFEGGAFERPGFGEWPYEGGEDEGVLARVNAFVRRPIFWGPLAGVIVAAVVAVILLMKRKNSNLSFGDDDAFN